MGIVLKRRDNADILKYVYGGIIDTIINKLDINESIKFLQVSIRDILRGKFDIKKFIITKSLRSGYKDPQRIAHKVLADRMGERDTVNKPKPNDRIPYVYIETPSVVTITETYIKLTNSSKFGKYLLIFKNKSSIIITITSDIETILNNENNNLYLQVRLKWDWDDKNHGYSIEYMSELAVLHKLCKKRLTKEPILMIGKVIECEIDYSNYDLMTLINMSVKSININKKLSDCIIRFNSKLFDRKQYKIKKSTLQGDRIEHPDFILKNNIKIDYTQYIEKQIMKPVCQIYGLIIENLDKKWKFPFEKDYYKKQYKKIMEEKQDEAKTLSKIRSMKEAMAKKMLFNPIIDQINYIKGLKKWNNWGFKKEK